MSCTRSCGAMLICANGPAESTSSVWSTRSAPFVASPPATTGATWPNSCRSSFCDAMSSPATHSTPTDPTCVSPRYSDRSPNPVRASSMFWKAPIASRRRHIPQPVTWSCCVSLKRCSTVKPYCPWLVPSPQCRASAIPRARHAPERHSPSSSRTGSARASVSLRKLALSANGASYRLNTPRNSVLGDSTWRTTTFAWMISAALFWRNPSVSNRLALAMNWVPALPPSSLTCCRL